MDFTRRVPCTRGTRYANVYKATGAFCRPLFLRLSCYLSPLSAFPFLLLLVLLLLAHRVPRAFSRPPHTAAQTHPPVFSSGGYGGRRGRRCRFHRPPSPLVFRRSTTGPLSVGRSVARSLGPQALFRRRCRQARKVASTAYE